LRVTDLYATVARLAHLQRRQGEKRRSAFAYQHLAPHRRHRRFETNHRRQLRIAEPGGKYDTTRLKNMFRRVSHEAAASVGQLVDPHAGLVLPTEGMNRLVQCLEQTQ